MSGQKFTSELRKVEGELKHYNAKVNALRKSKTNLKLQLYNYMEKHNLQELEGYTLTELKPKEKKMRKSKISTTQKKQNAISLFKNVGIINPEKFYEEFKNVYE